MNMPKETARKKYTAKVTGYYTTSWGSTTRMIEVDSEEEAKRWCEENSFMGGCQWYVTYLTENKK